MRSVKGYAPLNRPMVAQELLDSLHALLSLYEALDYSLKLCYVLPRTF